MTTIDSILFAIFVFAALFVVVGIPMLGIIWITHLQERNRIKRDEMLKSTFGQNIQIYKTFPLPPEIEEVVQGGLYSTIQHFRELIVGDTWLFIQPTFRNIPLLTLAEERGVSVLSLFSRRFDGYSPTFAIRNRQNNSLISSYYQVQVDNHHLINSELNFDDEQSLFAERGKHIQALQIMTPELLDVLKSAPAGADIVITKNQVYYFLSGEKPAEAVLDDILTHSSVVVKELEDNLERWGRSISNQAELEAIKGSDLAITLGEAYLAKNEF